MDSTAYSQGGLEIEWAPTYVFLVRVGDYETSRTLQNTFVLLPTKAIPVARPGTHS